MRHDGWKKTRETFRLHRLQREIERDLRGAKLSQSAIARTHGVSKSTVNRFAQALREREIRREQDGSEEREFAAPKRVRSKWKCPDCGGTWFVRPCPKCHAAAQDRRQTPTSSQWPIDR